MAIERIMVGITTFNREDQFWELFESIDVSLVDIVIAHAGSEEFPYSEKFKELTKHKMANIHYMSFDCVGGGLDYIPFEKKTPVVHLKKAITDLAKERECDHLFLVEDDIIIKNNSVWKYFIEFSNYSGIYHTNWNDAVPNSHIMDFTCSCPVYEGSVFVNAQGCFQYFKGCILDEFEWDTGYINALEHGDVEHQLGVKKLIPQFWNAVSPKGCGNYLTHDDRGKSTITGKEGYNENVNLSFQHWKNKWGYGVIDIKPISKDVLKRRLDVLERRYGEPIEKQDTNITNPVSIVVTIKNRCFVRYTSNKELLPNELKVMQQHDVVMSNVHHANVGRGGIELNKDLMTKPEGFRLFDNFVKSINKQAKYFQSPVELVVVDWDSKDDDVEEIIQHLWDYDYQYINITDGSKFSRGYGLDIGIKSAIHNHVHISDVDMIYTSPRFLEDASRLNKSAVFPVIAKQQSPSGLSLYMECAGFGIASMEKTTYEESGGFADIRKWGGEDNDLFEKVDKIIGKANVKRTMYHEVIHQWHSDIGRNL